ncbi:hypothetical protein B0T10DRAFT_546682 [Thelonectria olida]|uniref:Uncharacterized protein n=1 Tax=Thelonectria olida TaxID=1576542 RepID=A0A9P9AV17_9HYPO|nr:hypothetical protein B0T10DRAFT_546682 [Thelonectria olida]
MIYMKLVKKNTHPDATDETVMPSTEKAVTGDGHLPSPAANPEAITDDEDTLHAPQQPLKPALSAHATRGPGSPIISRSTGRCGRDSKRSSTMIEIRDVDGNPVAGGAAQDAAGSNTEPTKTTTKKGKQRATNGDVAEMDGKRWSWCQEAARRRVLRGHSMLQQERNKWRMQVNEMDVTATTGFLNANKLPRHGDSWAAMANVEVASRILIDEPEAGAKGNRIGKSKLALDGAPAERCETMDSA